MKIQYNEPDEVMQIPTDQEEKYMKSKNIDEVHGLVRKLIAYGQQHPDEDIQSEDFEGLIVKLMNASIQDMKNDVRLIVQDAALRYMTLEKDSDERVMSYQRLFILLKKYFKEEIHEPGEFQDLYESIKAEVV